MDQAANAFRRFLTLVPDHPGAHYNLAVTLKALGRMDEAIVHYRRTLAIRPDNAKAHNNLGVILMGQSNVEDASRHYKQALAISADYANAHYNYANLLKAQGELVRAIAHYRRALANGPDDAEVHNNLALALAADDQSSEAIVHYRRALTIRPDYAAAYSNLGSVLEAQSRVDEAIRSYTTALALDPYRADAHYNLAHAFDGRDRLVEAQAHYELALALDPAHAEAHNNFGVLSQHLGRFDEALARYRRAQALKPDYADAHWNEALSCLLQGDFETGWRKYEWRWRRKETPPRAFAAPLWDGSVLAGKTILLHTEQGDGDTLQFIRYAPLVRALGGTALLDCPKSLHRLFSDVAGVDHFVSDPSALPRIDVHAPLLSLPMLLGTRLETIPAAVPYLQPRPDLAGVWRERLSQLGGRRVGLVWRGNPAHSNDRRRSLAAAALAPLMQVAGVSAVSLQIDARPEELTALGELYDAGQALSDWADTAALISTLDLVVTVDTAVAHLAGALGKPVWVLLAFAPDWRWMLDRVDSPWYPTMRLFRQPSPGDWACVVAEVAAALAGWSEDHVPPAGPQEPAPARRRSRQLKPVMVVSHERSGTHFLMNALSYTYGYTAEPWIDVDLHNAAIDFSSPSSTTASLEIQAADPLLRLLKSHHSAELFGEALERIAETFAIFYVYRKPGAVMTSLWRHLNGLAWDEGPKLADPLALARAAPTGRLARYQAQPYPTMLKRWAAHVEGWLARANTDARITPVRYEDLDGDYDATVAALSDAVGRAPATSILRPPADVNVIAMGLDRGTAPASLAVRTALDAYCQQEIGPFLRRLGY